MKYIRVGMIRKGGYTKFVTKGFVQERDNISHGTLKKTILGKDHSKLFIAMIYQEGISQNYKLHVSVHVHGHVHIVSYGENLCKIYLISVVDMID